MQLDKRHDPSAEIDKTVGTMLTNFDLWKLTGVQEIGCGRLFPQKAGLQRDKITVEEVSCKGVMAQLR
jgi:hypothetical protein